MHSEVSIWTSRQSMNKKFNTKRKGIRDPGITAVGAQFAEPLLFSKGPKCRRQ